MKLLSLLCVVALLASCATPHLPTRNEYADGSSIDIHYSIQEGGVNLGVSYIDNCFTAVGNKRYEKNLIVITKVSNELHIECVE